MLKSLAKDKHSSLFVWNISDEEKRFYNIYSLFLANRTGHSRHQYRKTTVLSCHRSLIDTSGEKLNNI